MNRVEQSRRARPETALFVSAALLVSLGSLLVPSGGMSLWQIVLLAVGVALFGLPHGALDPWIARRAGLPLGRVEFTLVYLALALAVTALWWWQPVIMLALFLLISAWHFSDDWQAELPSWPRRGIGLALLSLPAWSHPEIVRSLFGFLAGPGGEQLAAGITAAGWLAVPVLAGAASWLLVAARPRSAIELLALLLLGWLATPLVYFVLYFCLLHSPRHLLAECGRTPRVKRPALFKVALVFTVATLALAVPVVIWLIQSGNVEQVLVRTVFIGLAALTVPHMALMFWVQRMQRA